MHSIYCAYNIYYKIKMVKVFTMVKGEVDVVRDWVLYHGHLFGFNNLHIIDNFSRDGTYEELLQLKKNHAIHVYRFPDYKKKGEYMSSLIKRYGANEFVFPVDIDEFIVHYDKSNNTISCEDTLIKQTLGTLPKAAAYKMNYIITNLTRPDGFKRATIECESGVYSDYGSVAKTFFHSSLFRGGLDHGNHFDTTNYYLTKLCLVHYHCRNLEQMKKKIYNNVSGLGHNPFDLEYLKKVISSAPQGGHHINHQISVLEGTFALHVDSSSSTTDKISLTPIINKIKSL
jgi:hypothetical protein